VAKTGMFVSLDIGTSSVKVVVSDFVDGQGTIIGVGNAKSSGVNKGLIVDIDKTVVAIKRAVAQAEEKAGIKINAVTVGLPANMVEIEKATGMIAVHSQSKEILDDDVRNVAAAALVRNIQPEREIINIIPQSFTIDGLDGIQDPRGMRGVRLEMEGVVYTGPQTIIHNVRKAVERAGLAVQELVVTPLALMEAILDDGEKDFGATVIDLGGGQTTTAVMHDKQFKFAHVNQAGGDFVTRDISVVLNASNQNAENLKINYGIAYSAMASQSEVFPVDVIGKVDPVNVDERYLSEIIEARYVEIFEESKEVLGRISALSLPGGIVLTGGAASIPGVVELASEVFEVPVKIYVPNHIGIRNPAFANVIAISDYYANLNDIYHLAQAALTGRVSTQVKAASKVAQQQAPVQQVVQPQQPAQNIGAVDVATQQNYYAQAAQQYGDNEESKPSKVGTKLKGWANKLFD
jgi:cell division protein FtsA